MANFHNIDLYKYTDEEFLVANKLLKYKYIKEDYREFTQFTYNNLDIKPIYIDDIIVPMDTKNLFIVLKSLMTKGFFESFDYDDKKIYVTFSKEGSEYCSTRMFLIKDDEFRFYYILKCCSEWFDKFSYPIQTKVCKIPFIKQNQLPYYFKYLIEKGLLDCACVDNHSVYPNYVIRGVTYEGQKTLKDYTKHTLDEDLILSMDSVNPLMLSFINNQNPNLYNEFCNNLYLLDNNLYNTQISFREEDGINIPVIEASLGTNSLNSNVQSNLPVFCDFARDDNPYSYIDYVKLLRKKGASTLVYSYCLKGRNKVHGFIFNKYSFDGDYKEFHFYRTNMISLYFKLIVDLNPKFDIEAAIIYGMIKYKGLTTKLLASKYGVNQMSIEKVIDGTYEVREDITKQTLYDELDISDKLINRIKNSIFEEINFEDIE